MMDVNYSFNNVGTVVSACTSEGSTRHYPRRLEKVKFGVDLNQVCKKNIPGPLLLILLKLNKEGPFRRDVFRAPGHQGNMRKLIHFLQQGRIINIQNFSVNTIASVLKKFLRKLPGGIFGPENEKILFQVMKGDNEEEKKRTIQSMIEDLPLQTQHLLVLLFGTFRVISTKSDKTGMTAEALGVSVAPSFFHTCSTGKTARMEDVERFKNATRVTSYFIQHFGMTWLFPKEIYEYYARLTGRILRVENKFIFFTYPLEMMTTRDDMQLHSTLSHRLSDVPETGSLEVIPENCALDPQGRLSISLDHGVSGPSSPVSGGGRSGLPGGGRSATLGRPKQFTSSLHPSNMDSKSFACLPQVHQRQEARMKARSDWFLSEPSGLVTVRVRPDRMTNSTTRPSSLGPANIVFTPDRLSGCTAETDPITGKPPDGQNFQGGTVALRRRLSDKDKERRLVRRSSSKRKDKENGGAGGVDTPERQSGPALKRTNSGESGNAVLSRAQSQDSSKGFHSRGGSFDHESPSTPRGTSTPRADTPSAARPLPRI